MSVCANARDTLKKNDANARIKLACLTKACHLFINGKDVPAKQSLPSLYCRMKFHVTEESVTLIHRFLQITQKYLELVLNACLAYITAITKMHKKAT